MLILVKILIIIKIWLHFSINGPYQSECFSELPLNPDTSEKPHFCLYVATFSIMWVTSPSANIGLRTDFLVQILFFLYFLCVIYHIFYSVYLLSMASESSGARPFEGIICWALADSPLSLIIYPYCSITRG